MKKLGIFAGIFAGIFVAFFAAGCGNFRQKPDMPIAATRSFFDGAITYRVAPEALRHMRMVEQLLDQVKEGELTDEDILPLYREADLNRDRNISPEEARAFYNQYVMRFEDAIGPVQHRKRK